MFWAAFGSELPSRAASCDRFAARLRLGQPDAFGEGASRDRNEVLAVRLWGRESGSIPQVALPHADGRAPRFVVAHEWKVKESVGADVLGGPQPQSNEIALWGGGGRPWFSIVRGRGRRTRRPGLRAAADVRPYRGRVSRVFGAKT